MPDPIFDIALMKRFDDSTAMTLVDVSPTDTFLIHDVVSNTIMKIPVSVLSDAITGAVTLAKGDVGLGNVDNTSDANKPVSTAQHDALTPGPVR